MAGDLFVVGRKAERLDAFAARIASLLNIRELERRESSAFVGEEYFVGVALSVRLTFARSDEIDLKDYPFWIHLKAHRVWLGDASFLDGLADLIARRLTVDGDRVVRLPHAEREGGPKVFYELNEDALQASRDQVSVRTE